MMLGKQQIHTHSIGFRKMRNLVEHILNKEYDTANQIFESEIETVTRIKLNEAKKMVAARMAEQVPEFMGAAGGNAVKLRRGVLEEDDLDEMDLSREKPDYDSIEDRRGEKPNFKVGDWWAKSQWKKMGQKVSQQQADDINSGRLKSRGPFDNLDRPRQKSTGFQIGGARPGSAGKNSQSVSGAIFQKKQLEEQLTEESEEQLDEARIKILKARVRGGKVQRRRKVSNVEGHKIVDGKLKRMSPAERRRRKLGQKRGKLKRRSKMRQSLMKRRRSLKRRAAIGL